MPTKVESAVERVMERAQHEASPDFMSQEEAVEFYELLASQCRDWAETIGAELAAR